MAEPDMRMIPDVMLEVADDSRNIRFAIRGRILDGTGAPPIEDGVIVISGRRIEAVGREAEFGSSLKDLPTVDYKGGTILPGLIDTHVHLGKAGSPEPLKDSVPRIKRMHDTMHALHVAQQAWKNLWHGITTIRDMHCAASSPFAVFSLREAINSGIAHGSRIVAAGRAICMIGGHGSQWISREISGMDESVRAVREVVREGSDFVKMMATVAWGPIPGKPLTNIQQLTRDEMTVGVDMAHRLGKLAAVHARSKQSIIDALAAGFDSIEHGSQADQAVVDEMVRRDVYLVPTIQSWEMHRRHGVTAQTPAWQIADVEYIIKRDRPGIAAAIRGGVKIAAGTDAGNQCNPHGEMATELELYVELGMPVMRAIESATRVAANLIELGDRVGTLQAGKLADVIGVPGDPLKDLGVLRRVDLVIKDGSCYRDDRGLRQKASLPDALAA